MDERHDTPCGPAVKKLCERAYTVFGQTAAAWVQAIGSLAALGMVIYIDDRAARRLEADRKAEAAQLRAEREADNAERRTAETDSERQRRWIHRWLYRRFDVYQAISRYMSDALEKRSIRI